MRRDRLTDERRAPTTKRQSTFLGWSKSALHVYVDYLYARYRRFGPFDGSCCFSCKCFALLICRKAELFVAKHKCSNRSKCKFLPFQEVMTDRPTNHPTDRQTDRPRHREIRHTYTHKKYNNQIYIRGIS